MPVSSTQYVKEFFKDTGEGRSECDLCHKTYAKDNGNTNLMNHLKNQHTEYVRIYGSRHPTDLSTQSTLDSFFGASSKAKQLWFWTRKVVLVPEPFSYVENPTAREGSAYEGISVDTLKRHMMQTSTKSRKLQTTLQQSTF